MFKPSNMLLYDEARKRYWRMRSNWMDELRRLRFGLSHRGDNRLCNICGWQGDEFFPLGQIADVRCPACLSLPRHRLSKAVLDRLAIPKRGYRILHVSPKGEKGLAAWFKSLAKAYLSIDLGGRWNSFADSEAMVQMDLTSLKLPNDSVDFVMCSHVLENIENDQQAINEIYRVLAPRGTAVLQVQMYGDVTTHVDVPTEDDYWHVWHPGTDYFRRYEAAGFAVTKYGIDCADELLAIRPESLVVPICTKQPLAEPAR